jgi:hypothetical protein
VTPLRPGETDPTQKHRDSLVDGFRPPSRPARTAFRRRSYSLGLGTPGKPFAPDLRSLEVRGKRRVSEEIASSSEVSSLLTNLVTLEPPQVRAYRFTSESNARLRPPFSSLDLNQLLPEGHVAAVSAAGSEPSVRPVSSPELVVVAQLAEDRHLTSTALFQGSNF